LPAGALRLLGVGLAEALVAIHAAGVVHRDLKPGNVLLADDGPRLIDFGIARAADATALTRTGAVIGTPGYIAPEQVEHGVAGPASDVFALGGLLLHAATGRPPFGEGGAAVVLYRVLHTEPDLQGVPPELAATVAACLQRDPARRPDPHTLVAGLSGRGPLPPPPHRGAPTTVGAPVPRPPAPVTPPLAAPVPARPRRRGLAAAAVVLALLLAGGMALLLRPDPGSGGTTSTGAVPTPPASSTASSTAAPTRSAAPTPEDASAQPAAEQVVRDFPTATGFTTPSGNIACLVLPDGARCDIADKDWGDTEPGRPPDCTQAFGDALEVSGTGRGDFVCHGDTVFGSPTLPYGETIRVGDAECDSRENGVECRVLSTRHGFAMSRTRYTLF
jgi:hypothetical protein